MTTLPLSPEILDDAKRKAALGCTTTRALLESLRLTQTTLDSRSIALGVGNGGGNLFVYGDYESIKAAQTLILGQSTAK